MDVERLIKLIFEVVDRTQYVFDNSYMGQFISDARIEHFKHDILIHIDDINKELRDNLGIELCIEITPTPFNNCNFNTNFKLVRCPYEKIS